MKPGDKAAVVLANGEMVEDTVHSVYYTSAQPEIRQQPTGWRKLLRQLTPHRLRKPLPIVRPAQPANVEVVMKGDVERRAQKTADRINRKLDSLGVSSISSQEEKP